MLCGAWGIGKINHVSFDTCKSHISLTFLGLQHLGPYYLSKRNYFSFIYQMRKIMYNNEIIKTSSFHLVHQIVTSARSTG